MKEKLNKNKIKKSFHAQKVDLSARQVGFRKKMLMEMDICPASSNSPPFVLFQLHARVALYYTFLCPSQNPPIFSLLPINRTILYSMLMWICGGLIFMLTQNVHTFYSWRILEWKSLCNFLCWIIWTMDDVKIN